MKRRYPKFLKIVLSLLALGAMLAPTGVVAHNGAEQGKAVFPNPFYEGTTFELTMPRESKIRIDVYNIRGQHIRNLFGGEAGELHPAGEYPVPWDGKDKFGVPVLPGIYLCVLRADGVTIKSVKVIKLEK